MEIQLNHLVEEKDKIYFIRTPYIFLFFISLILFSCKEKTTNNNSKPTKKVGFELHGIVDNFHPEKVYLNKINNNSLTPIDSAKINNHTFLFKGFVDFPERFAITFKNYSKVTIVILENKKIEIQIYSTENKDAIIKNSPLNNELQSYKNKSKNIFKKINYLFPRFQKARIENNSNKLNEIGKEIKLIEQEFTNFSFDYVKKHPDSYVSTMILRDQLKSTLIDTLKIKTYYSFLSSKVKKSPDSEVIKLFLNLH